jgi:hypothetical protein
VIARRVLGLAASNAGLNCDITAWLAGRSRRGTLAERGCQRRPRNVPWYEQVRAQVP